jgi:hypothetical protein
MKNYSFGFLSFILLVAALQSCAPTRAVMPLCYKENRISASVGGPIIRYGDAVLPVPQTSVTYSRGLSDSVTLFASFYPTAAIFGNLQLEVGFNRYLVNNDSAKFAVTVAPSIHYFRKDSIGKVYPQIDVNFVKRNPLNENYFYAGLSNWFEPSTRKVDGEKQTNIWFPSPQIGYVWNTEKGFMFQTEFKYLVPFRRNDTGPVDYIGPFMPYGGMGLYLGFAYKF